MRGASAGYAALLWTRIESRSVLDRQTLDEALDLIEQTTHLEGHRPVGEHKYQHLKVGATGWLGVLARQDDRLIGYAHTRWGRPDQRPRGGRRGRGAPRVPR